MILAYLPNFSSPSSSLCFAATGELAINHHQSSIYYRAEPEMLLEHSDHQSVEELLKSQYPPAF
jgi:hypothetical protein